MKKLPLTIFFLALILEFSVGAQSNLIQDDNIYHPPSAAFTNTKYAADCGGVSQSLKEEMPPVEDQGQSPWCATYSAKALLDYHIHKYKVKTQGSDNYSSPRLSATDLNSLDTFRPAKERGVLPNLDLTGSNAMGILEAGQRSPGVYNEKDLPFDQALFDQKGQLAALSEYYDRLHLSAKMLNATAFQCQDRGPWAQELENRFPGLPGFLHAEDNKDSFLAAIKKKYFAGQWVAPMAKRAEIFPPYNIRKVQASTGDSYIEELQANLKAKQPVTVSVCAAQLKQLPGLDSGNPVPPQDKNKCEAHAMVVTGMKVVNGKCVLQVRNSWGLNWPYSEKKPGDPASDGYADIAVEDFLKIAITHDGLAELHSISERALGAPAQNTVINQQGSFVGQTEAGQPTNGKANWYIPELGKSVKGDVNQGVMKFPL